MNESLPHHIKRTLVLGLPLVGSHLAQMSLHVTDTVMLGWYGVAELAAVVLGASLFFSVFILGSGFGIAVMGSISAALGRGDDTEMRRSARMALWLSLLYGTLVYPLFFASAPAAHRARTGSEHRRNRTGLPADRRDRDDPRIGGDGAQILSCGQ